MTDQDIQPAPAPDHSTINTLSRYGTPQNAVQTEIMTETLEPLYSNPPVDHSVNLSPTPYLRLLIKATVRKLVFLCLIVLFYIIIYGLYRYLTG